MESKNLTNFTLIWFIKSNGPRHEKTCLQSFADNKAAVKPAHLCSLIRAFVIRVLESIISKLGTREF